MKEDTWILYWDDTVGGFISHDVLHALSKKVGILGPTAAIFGRDFEYFLASEKRLVWSPVEKLEQSIQNTKGTLNRDKINPTGNSFRRPRWNYSGENQEWQERGQPSSEWM